MMRAPRPSISVVIPVHNRAGPVMDALDSVMAQSVLPSEVIVVDDASSDETVTAVRRRSGDPVPVRVEALTENRGGGHARNRGVQLAQGQLLAFLDSDDAWEPQKLERQLDALANVEDDFVCFTNLKVDRGDGAPPLPWNSEAFGDRARPEEFILERNQAIQTSTLLMPTALARAVAFDERLRRHQDIDLILRLAQRGARFVYVPQELVLYSADPAATRVSRRKNAKPSLVWLDLARAYVPQRLLSAFYMREIFGMEFEDAPAAALLRAGRIVARREMPAARAARIVLREALPERAKRTMKLLRGRA